MFGIPNLRVLSALILFITGLALWALMVFIMSTDETGRSTAMDGVMFGLIFCFLPLGAVGAVLAWSGLKAHRSDYTPLLAMVQSRGQVQLWQAAQELKCSPDQIRQLIYRAVHQNAFNGYICWDDGILYSAEAQALSDMRQCPRCGGQIRPAGLGVLRCGSCDTEIFLKQQSM
jgi:hypothetical protein